MASSGASALIGTIEPARIVAFDLRSAGGGGVGSSVSDIANDLLGGGSPAPAPDGATSYTYTIQFNPSEMSIDAQRMIKSVVDAQSGKNAPDTVATSATNSNVTNPPTIMLTTRLVFDEVNLSDAFFQENVTSPASASFAKAVASQVSAQVSGQEWTVQPIVEGFIGALRNDKTRLIRFEWAEFYFTGFLHYIGAEYVMFSRSGNPIRAFVNLRLKCDLRTDMNGWLSDYKDMFGNSPIGATLSSEYNIEKALLLVDSDPEDSGQSDDDSSGSGSWLDSISSALGFGGLGGGSGSGSPTSVEVQFNPSTLRIDSNAETETAKYMLSHMEGLPNIVNREASIIMNVDLIFDAVNNSDAFHADSLSLSPTSIASSAVSAATGTSGQKYSVLTQTNGMVALLIANDSTITFKWGKMTFTGIVTEVQARYIMFSPSGQPIRSKVSIRVNQAIRNDSGYKYWDNAYESFFGNENALAAHARDALQTQQSIFNL
jgi:hypothetical protein